jgi:hypothetical protein
MGTTLSKVVPQGQISREKLIRSDKYKETQEEINKLFMIFAKELTPEDYRRLGSKTSCEKYVMGMAESMKKIFHIMRIHPKKDKSSGVVVFQRIEELKTPVKDEDIQEKNEICLSIAYFYIRLFQIFGALALTVIDDPGAGVVLDTFQQRPVRFAGGAADLYNPYGYGARRREEVEAERRKQQYFRELYRLFGDAKKVIKGTEFIEEYPLRKYTNITVTPENTRNLKIQYDDNSSLSGKFIFQEQPSTGSTIKYKISLTNFTYSLKEVEKISKYRIEKYLEKYETAPIEINIFGKGDTWKVITGTSTINPPDFVDKFNNVLKNIKENIGLIVQNQYEHNVMRIVKNVMEDKEKEKATAEDIRGIPNALQNEYINKILKSMYESGKSDSISFCLARALQLLAYPIRPSGAITSICFSPFSSAKASVPTFEKPITEAAGIRSLDQLYYESDSTQKVSQSDEAEYAAFLKQMATLFGKPEMTVPSRAANIIAKQPACKINTEDVVSKYLQVMDKEAIRQVLTVVNQMFAYQFQHAQKVIQFIKKNMFVLKKDKDGKMVPSIHPALLQGGVDAIDKLSAATRKFLLEYYSNCEKRYQMGVEILLKSKGLSSASAQR